METRERNCSGPKQRSPSPTVSRRPSSAAPKRCVSAERKRPTTPNKTKAGKDLPEPLCRVSRAPSPKLGNSSANKLENNSKPVRPTTTLDHNTSDHKMKISPRPRMVIVAPSARRLSLDGGTTSRKPLHHKSASDLLMLISRDEMSSIERGSSVDDRWMQQMKPSSSTSSRPASPSSSRSINRGLSPSRSNKTSSSSSRGTSPARVMRPSSPSRHITPVLSYNANIKKGKKDASNAEDVHQLRMLHNRHMQWQFANAQADAAMHSQKKKAEKMLYSLWRRIVSDLLVSVREKRCYIQQLKFKLKLYSILQSQVTFVDEWSSMERDHNNSLKLAIQHLQNTIVCIPVTLGARGDIKSVEAAVGCVIDVMSSLGSSLCSILSQVEGMNCMASELADLAARERVVLDECESLLVSTHQLQEEEYSLRIHLLQMIQASKSGRKP